MKKILDVGSDQAAVILALLKCVATAQGTLELHEVHKATLHAFAEHLFHTEFDVDGSAGTLEGARDAVADPDLQRDVMNMAGIIPFLEEADKEARVETFEKLGEALGFSRKFARELHKLCHGSVAEVAICQIRPLLLESGVKILPAPFKFLKSQLNLDGNHKMLARYEGYRDLSEGTFGKVLTEYYRDNEFPLPGTKGAIFSNTLMVHDMHHVLTGYPTTPLGETCVIAFADGMMDLDFGKALIGFVAQFQVGIQFDKGLEAWRNQINPDLVIHAFERGGRATVNFEHYDFDFLPYLEQPIAEVRAQFGIDPDGAIVRGPDDLWCGDMGIVGMRKSPDMIERKLTWFQKLLAGKNLESDLST